MLCPFCKKNEATIHYTEVLNNQVKKIDVCEACAKAKGINIELPFSFSDILTALSKEMLGGAVAEKGKKMPACPGCKMRLSDFVKQGRIGCARCYATFAEALQDVLQNVQKLPHHVGKVPRRFWQSEDARRRVAELEKQLREAVTQERYEDCVALRDAIKGLKEARKNNADAQTTAQ